MIPSGSPLDEAMTPSAVEKAMHHVGQAFQDQPYAVCGLAAMVHYGFEERLPRHISIVCPVDKRNEIRAWANASQFLRPLPDISARDTFAVELTTPSGQLLRERTVRIKFTRAFDDLTRTWVEGLNIWVLTLPSLVNQVALGYTQSLLADDSLRCQKAYASDISWLLKRITQDPSERHKLRPGRVPEVVHTRFWVPFTASYPASIEVFAAAGLRLQDCEEPVEEEH